MYTFLGIFVVVILLLLYVFVRRPKTQGNVRPVMRAPTPSSNNPKYHAVSLKITTSACDAAKAMEGRRFLSTTAPRLPLADCNATECRCRFSHHNDRRRSEDRRASHGWGYGGSNTGDYEKEQRSRGERRDDSPDDFSK